MDATYLTINDNNEKKIIKYGRKRWIIENKEFNDSKKMGYCNVTSLPLSWKCSKRALYPADDCTYNHAADGDTWKEHRNIWNDT